ncbi:MAG: type 1 glutamine amidotransferase [Nitrosomonas sp.]|nr:type 1 glutamine amidotransferase [Nitrosomonas sp.]
MTLNKEKNNSGLTQAVTKPVAIFRFFPIEGPGYFATFLDQHAVPWQLLRLDEDDSVPDDLSSFSGLVLMGGPMSVHDNLPWITPIIRLIKQAVTSDIPVMGNCLGGQLLATALGGQVSNSPIKELGWGKVEVSDTPIARNWLGNITEFEAFHWHGETFSLPQGATRLLSSMFCTNQAFIFGKHIGLQCHLEMTSDMVKEWCLLNADELQQNQTSPAVQTPDEIQSDLHQRVPALQTVAYRIYKNWITTLDKHDACIQPIQQPEK